MQAVARKILLSPIAGDSRRKQSLVAEAVEELAKKLGPDAKLPTTREMAAALEVTGATLALALRELEGRGILHCRHGSGIYVAPGAAQKRVGLIFGENIFSPGASEFGSLMLRYCETRAAQRNERFSFFLDRPALHGEMNGAAVPAHQDLVDALKGGRLNGLIIVGRSSEEQERWLRAQGIPVVRAVARLGSCMVESGAVSFDYQELIAQGVERLRKAGCRTVGLLAPLREHGEMFRAVLHARGMTAAERWIVRPDTDDSFASELHDEMGREFARRLLDGTPGDGALPDGLLITDDMMASGALPELQKAGLKIGRDLKVASHANKGSRLLAKWDKAIFRVEFDPAQAAEAMFQSLEALMNGESSGRAAFVEPIPAPSDS